MVASTTEDRGAMIVTCPSCSSRYRIAEDKIQGKGARITCPSCSHKFVVYRDPAEGQGVAVTIAKKGEVQKTTETSDEEEEAPTTLMPHGSAMTGDMRKLAEVAQAKLNAKAAAPESTSLRSHVQPQAPAPAAAGGSNQGAMIAVIAIILIGLVALAWSLHLFE